MKEFAKKNKISFIVYKGNILLISIANVLFLSLQIFTCLLRQHK